MRFPSKKILLIALALSTIGISTIEADTKSNKNYESLLKASEILDQYKDLLDAGTYEGQNWSNFESLPLSRYYTFKLAFELFLQNNGKVIVELGTSRSFVHGGLVGCNSNDTKYWTPDQPKNWDWGAGFFTGMAAQCLAHVNPQIFTVDLARSHIDRCKVMTKPYKYLMSYHVCSSVDFLKNMPSQSADLIYLDTGDMWPIEPTAMLQLEEAKVIVSRNLLKKNGILLIDDVKNQTPKKFGEQSDLGKSKYSIPYLLMNGFEIIADEYQVVMRKKS